MSDAWSLEKILEYLHEGIHQRLKIARDTFGHPVAKGEASENVWLNLFKEYLPERYRAEKAFVVDSKGIFSQQMDVVIFDRQYSPFIFKFDSQVIVPSESVYAVFEAKQSINVQHVNYAQEKIKSVRQLHRTSLPIPHAGGTYPAKPSIEIHGGILSFESEWSPAMGEPLRKALLSETQSGSNGYLNIGCIAAHGYFYFNKVSKSYEFVEGEKPATEFLFKLISLLQVSGTVPMIDVLAYSEWLTKSGS